MTPEFKARVYESLPVSAATMMSLDEVEFRAWSEAIGFLCLEKLARFDATANVWVRGEVMPSGPWIQTLSGVAFDLVSPAPESVRLRDIAGHLARICRFTGGCLKPYSVAQHSVLVCDNLPPEFRVEGLLHDAAEAYVGDVSQPLKQAMRSLTYVAKGYDVSVYDDLEARVNEAVRIRFRLGRPMSITASRLVKIADARALATERRDLLGACSTPWHAGEEPFPEKIEPLEYDRAEALFLARAIELGLESHG